MSYRITDECVACGTCTEACEESAIVENQEKYEINDKCVECGKCVDSCPVEAIIKE